MERLRLGIVSRTATYWQYYVGLREGHFRQHDIDLEMVVIGTTAAGIPALLEERVDVAGTCPDLLIGKVLEGLPLRIAGGLINTCASSVVAGPGITGFNDLRGRRVAVTEERGSVSTFLRALLRRKGLQLGDYEQVVCSTTPVQVAALEQGAVDAAMLTHPFEAHLLGRGFNRLARVGDELGPGSFTTLNVRAGWTSEPVWARLQAALCQADAVIRDRARKDAVLAALAEGTGVPEAEMEEAYELYTGSANVLAASGELDLRGLDNLLAYMAEDGIPVQPGRGSDFLDASAAAR